MPPCAIGTRFATVTLKWAYTGLDHILPSYMRPVYQSRRLQIWLLGTCCLLGPQRHVQERPENLKFSGVTNMQVSMGWFIADCHQEISRTLIHLLVHMPILLIKTSRHMPSTHPCLICVYKMFLSICQALSLCKKVHILQSSLVLLLVLKSSTVWSNLGWG